MQVFYQAVSLLGGLALFLYGMRVMGDGLKSSSGGAMRTALEKATANPALAFLLGVLVTCMIQSSTATIVLTVGLVGAGFLKFRQSIGIVLGANVGTAITAQIIRLMDVSAGADSPLYFFKSDNLAPLALLIGMILIMFVKKRSATTAGTICMGFGMLFVGLMNMSAAVAEVSDSLSTLLVSFEDNYILGFLSGVFVTGVIQSSSAVVGILQSIASTMGVHFCGVFAIIIGVNIGDCLTTYLVCRLGAKPEQIRTCMVHIIYNVFAAVLIIAVLVIGHSTGLISDEIWNMPLKAGGVANVHGLFRLVPAVLLLPFSGLFANIAEKIVKDAPVNPEDEKIEANLRKLDPRLVTNPAIALDQSEQLIANMAEVALHNYDACRQQLFEFEQKREDRIQEREEMLDRMADAANRYIIAISPHVKLEKDNRTQNYQLKALVCFERIGDLAVNITGNIRNLREAKREFSPMAQQEMKIMLEAIRDILEMTAKAHINEDTSMAFQIEPMEEVIDAMVADLRGRHIYRMTHDQCDVINGIEFQNMLVNLERISDQCSDLAVYLLGRTDDSINGKEHEYIHNLHHSNNKEYLELFHDDYKKYFDQLNAVHPGEYFEAYGEQQEIPEDIDKDYDRDDDALESVQ
ncbi:MAG: Na/Pi cotransporter family protein [Firmicutes bacterium]|nr:Na/Pi cotransporter family protein [Bacillota bacterium]